jgi:hypothetical protein
LYNCYKRISCYRRRSNKEVVEEAMKQL